MARRNGIPQTVKYLKASSVFLQQSLGGHKHSNTRDLGVAVARTGSGIPRIIPAQMRKMLRKDRRYVIAWLTILNIYRVLVFPGKLKLSTITKPGKMLPGDLIVNTRIFIQKTFWPMLIKKRSSLASASMEVNERGNPLPVTSWARLNLQPKYFPIQKASSVGGEGVISTSLGSMILAAKAWALDADMRAHFNEWVRLLTPGPAYKAALVHGKHSVPPIVAFKSNLEELGSMELVRRVTKVDDVPRLGRLALKEEAAGKIRVFAIVDCWTQWMLHPLHKAIFALLRRIPQDGTFDQIAPVRRLKLTNKTFVASYDLSAATDRLPLIIQKMVLAPVIGSALAEV